MFITCLGNYTYKREVFVTSVDKHRRSRECYQDRMRHASWYAKAGYPCSAFTAYTAYSMYVFVQAHAYCVSRHPGGGCLPVNPRYEPASTYLFEASIAWLAVAFVATVVALYCAVKLRFMR